MNRNLKRWIKLSKCYDLGYEQCRVDTNNPKVQQKPLNKYIDPFELDGIIYYHKKEKK